MWQAVVGKLLGSVAPEVAKYYQQRQALKHERELEKLKGKIEWEKAQTKRASESEGRDHEWETLSIQNSGWKDEFVLIVLSIPLVLVFIPPATPYIMDGFNTLAQTPEWYRWLILMIYTAVFGIRIWRRKL